MKSASNQKWIGMVGALAGLLTGVVTAQTPAGPATPGAASQALVEPAMAAPQLRHVAARTGLQSVQLALEITGEYQFHPLSSGSRLLLVDLPGVSTREASVSHLLDSQLVSSYRVVGYLRESQPSARLEVLLKLPAAVEYLKTATGLEVRLSAIPVAASVPATPAARPTASTSAAAPAVVRAASATRGDRLDRIEIARGAESGNVQIQVRSNGVLQYKAFELREPHRLVLDIPNVVASHAIPVGGTAGMTPLRQVRVGQFQQTPPITRVVFELDAQAGYDLRPSAAGLEIEIRSSRSATPVRPAAAEPVATALQMPSISERMPNSVDAVFASVRNLMSASRVDLVEAPKTEPEQAAAPAPPAALIQPRKAPVEQALAQVPVQPRPGTITMPTQPAAQAPAVRRYSGEPISINVKDVDLKDFFRLIHEISGLNVILDRGVTGTLTMVLDDVPWDQALDIVLRNNQLDSVLDGNVLRIATLDTLKREQRDMADMAKAQQETVDRVTVSRSVNYAKATDLAVTIRKFLSARADIVADDRTNQLIITDIPQSIPTLDEVLKQLDKRTQQVEIEARIVAASRQFVRELGAQFGFAAFAGTRNTVLGGNPITGNDSPLTGRPFTPPFAVGGGQAIPLFSNFPAAGGNVGFTISNNTPDFSLDLILTAAESRGIGKTLSRPKIVTQNNQRGSIQQGVQIPIQTTVNNTVSTQLTDVTLAMTVTPQVTPDNNIFLEVTVTNRNIAAGIARINGIPALNKQEATTRVLVADGATVVFGGVIANENTLSIQQVPILGSIPIIGNLFKRTGVSTSTNELLFFITPKII